MKVSLAAKAEPGQAVPRHEDFYCVETSLGMFAIAEGLGPAGGLLARMVLRTLRQFMVEHRRDPERAAHRLPSHRLHVGLMVAHRAVIESETQAGESRLVIDAAEASDLRGGRKPIVDVAARDGQDACNVVIVGSVDVSRNQGQLD